MDQATQHESGRHDTSDEGDHWALQSLREPEHPTGEKQAKENAERELPA